MSSTAGHWRRWAGCGLALVVVAAYWPGRGGGFVFDDFPNLVDNVAVHVTTLRWQAWAAAVMASDAGPLARPLAMATFALNHYFTGLDPVPMKLTNIAIHAANALLALGLLRALLALAAPAVSAARRDASALLAASAWALHPINLMAVLFVVQRMESLSHTFVLAGLWLYLAGRSRQLSGEPGGGWRIAAGLLGGTLLGALAKESAVLLPAYAAAVEACLLGLRREDGGRDRRLITGYVLVLALPAVLGLAWLLPKVATPAAYATRGYSLGERLLTEAHVVTDYLRWTVFPSLRQLSLYHDDYPVSRGLLQPPSTAIGMAVLAALFAAALLLRRRRPLAALGIAWFLLAQLLTATVVPFELVYEHRNYFASLGICLAVADLLVLAPRGESQRRVAALVAVLWLAWLGLTTHLRAREWSDPWRFAVTEAAKHPDSPRATYAHARLAAMATGGDPASPLVPGAMQALAAARRFDDGNVLAYSASIVVASRLGQPVPRAWWEGLEDRLRRRPPGAQETGALAALETCALDGGCNFAPADMLAAYEAATSRRADAEVSNLRGEYLFTVLGRRAGGIASWREAVALRPSEPQYRVNLVKALVAVGAFDQARAEIAALRRSGRLHQHEDAARALERRLQDVRAAPSPPAADGVR